jgi:hypothetical protein
MPTTQRLKNRDADRSPDAQPTFPGTTPMLSAERSRSISRELTPDLRNNCPVCGAAYQPGENVLALACFPLEAGAAPPFPAVVDCAPGSRILLGHHGCVLPRLLTLISCFRPETRFVNAFHNVSAAESRVPEGRHDEP